MKVALAQMDVIPNMPKKNLETMLDMINQAKKEHADVIAFPEMSVGGYLVGDKWLDDNFCENLEAFNSIIKDASKGIGIVYGNIFTDNELNKRTKDNGFHPNIDGRTRKYNGIYAFQNGKAVERKKETDILPKGVQPKTLLPNYRFFDDKRYFFSTENIAKDFNIELKELLQPFMFEIDGKKVPIGLEMCEDLWCNDYRKNGEALNPTKMLIENGAEFIINISASPWTYGKNDARDRRVKFLKEEIGENFVPFLYVNCSGAQNNGKNIVTFDGGTTAYNKEGRPVKFAKKSYDNELVTIEQRELEKKDITRETKSMIAEKHDAIIEGIQHMKNIFGSKEQPKYVIGLSGGIDSAVNAALLVKAVGKENVFAVNMPTQYNSDKTKNAAKKIAENLNIKYEEIPIEDLVDANTKTIEKYDIDGSGRNLSELNEENIQAKIRGTSIISNLAGKYNWIFSNNGNKLEIAIGYATLYGDVNGAIAPIGDLTKSEVYEIAEYINEDFGREIIPEALIPDELFRFNGDKIEPSAELKNEQVDPIKIGYHCALINAYTDFKKKTAEDVMQWYMEGTLEKNLGISNELIERWNVDDPKEFIKDLEWFDKMVHTSVYKRVQAPPIIITSKSSYGYDIRESQLPYETSLKFDKLKEKVLNMNKYEEKK